MVAMLLATNPQTAAANNSIITRRPDPRLDKEQQFNDVMNGNGNNGSIPPTSPLSSTHQTSPGLGPNMDGGNGPPPPVPTSQLGAATQAGGTAPGAAAAAQKRPVRRGGKPPPDRPTRALFCLSLKNPIRKLCIDIVEWK